MYMQSNLRKKEIYLPFRNSYTRPHFPASKGCNFSNPRNPMLYSGLYTIGH